MTFVVEIEGPDGSKAVKEYYATSTYELVYVVAYDLRDYPDFQVTTAWHKEEPARRVHIGTN